MNYKLFKNNLFMKKLFTILTLFCCFSIATQAQSKAGTFGLQVETGYAFNIAEDNYPDMNYHAWNIAVSPGYYVTDKLFVGAGIALYDYRSNEVTSSVHGSQSGMIKVNSSFVSIPVYAHGLWKFRAGAKPSWFVSLKAGYGIISKSMYPIKGIADLEKIESHYSGGLYLSPSIGYMYPINSKNAISLSVSYDLQKYTEERDYKTETKRVDKTDNNNSTIAVKIGWAF